MRYLMLVHGDPDETCLPEEGAIVAGVDKMNPPQGRIPKRRRGDSDRVATARPRRGKVLVTDGPFPETKEGMSGGRTD